MKRKRKQSQAETRRFIERMKAMKQTERAGDVEVFDDNLLRVTVAVRVGADWYMVPKRAGGWQHRQRLTITPEVRSERLKPAKGIDPAWLGVQVTSSGAEAGSTSQPSQRFASSCVRADGEGTLPGGNGAHFVPAMARPQHILRPSATHYHPK